MIKKNFTLSIYWEYKPNCHKEKLKKFATVKEAVDYALTELDAEKDWTVFDENDEIVADKGEYL